jgi:hypothetical protein
MDPGKHFPTDFLIPSINIILESDGSDESNGPDTAFGQLSLDENQEVSNSNLKLVFYSTYAYLRFDTMEKLVAFIFWDVAPVWIADMRAGYGSFLS